jgi:streptolysin S family bacteriocin protoxin
MIESAVASPALRTLPTQFDRDSAGLTVATPTCCCCCCCCCIASLTIGASASAGAVMAIGVPRVGKVKAGLLASGAFLAIPVCVGLGILLADALKGMAVIVAVLGALLLIGAFLHGAGAQPGFASGYPMLILLVVGAATFVEAQIVLGLIGADNFDGSALWLPYVVVAIPTAVGTFYYVHNYYTRTGKGASN